MLYQLPGVVSEIGLGVSTSFSYTLLGNSCILPEELEEKQGIEKIHLLEIYLMGKPLSCNFDLICMNLLRTLVVIIIRNTYVQLDDDLEMAKVVLRQLNERKIINR